MNASALFNMIRWAFITHVPGRDQSGTSRQRHATKAGPGRMPFRRTRRVRS
jgi:hypothetical protein